MKIKQSSSRPIVPISSFSRLLEIYFQSASYVSWSSNKRTIIALDEMNLFTKKPYTSMPLTIDDEKRKRLHLENVFFSIVFCHISLRGWINREENTVVYQLKYTPSGTIIGLKYHPHQAGNENRLSQIVSGWTITFSSTISRLDEINRLIQT